VGRDVPGRRQCRERAAWATTGEGVSATGWLPLIRQRASSAAISPRMVLPVALGSLYPDVHLDQQIASTSPPRSPRPRAWVPAVAAV
jgi:hypothetical protein